MCEKENYGWMLFAFHIYSNGQIKREDLSYNGYIIKEI